MLAGNQIDRIDHQVFDSMSKLAVLILANNDIRHIDPYSFETLSKLRILDIHGNKMSIVLPHTFAGLDVAQMNLTSVDVWADLDPPAYIDSIVEQLLKVLVQFDSDGTFDLDAVLPTSITNETKDLLKLVSGIQDLRQVNVAQVIPEVNSIGRHAFPATVHDFKLVFFQYLFAFYNGKLKRRTIGLLADDNPSRCI